MIMKKLPMAIAPLAIAILLALIAGRLYADPQMNTSSPQSDMTRGKIESDADYFMSVRNYANMDFDKWWGAVSYKTQFGDKIMANSEFAQIGFATRFGGLYTALSYRGNGFRDFGKWPGAGSSVYSHSEKTENGRTWKVFDSMPVLGSYANSNIRNEASVLLGLADMGFGLYFASDYQSSIVDDYIVGNFYYKSLRQEYGHINPGITWGMTRDLIPGRGIKPQVTVDLDFYRQLQMKEDFTDNTNPTIGSSGTQIEVSQNRFIPGLNLGMGAITLAKVDNFSLDVDLDYGVKLYLYENDYSYQDDAGKFQVKTLKGGSKLLGGTIAEIFQIGHSLTPSINAGWSGDRLRLGCRLSVPMTVSTTNQTDKTLKPDSTDGSLIKNGYDSITTNYTLKPVLDLAMQWEIVPSRLFLNAGGKLSVFEAYFNTVEKAYYENDVENKTGNFDRGKYIENIFLPAETTLYLGVTFNLTANIELQAALGMDSNNNINVFYNSFSTDNRNRPGGGTGGFINFGNILVALKY